jgi:hypothetical protein
MILQIVIYGCDNLFLAVKENCPSQWPHRLRHELSSPDRNTRVVGSNSTRGVDICVRLFCVCVVLCIGRGLATG